MKTKKISTFLIALTVLGLGFAQMKDPASWQFKTKQISDNETELQFIVTLDEGWHIYSQHTDQNGPIGISFTFDNSKDYKKLSNVTEPKAHEEYDELFKCTVRSFEKSVTFRQRVKALSEKDFKVTGKMSYQLCNEGSCIPPDDVPFSFNVKGAVAAPETDTATVAEENTDTVAATADTAVASSDTTDTQIVAPGEPEKEKQSLLVVFLIALGAGLLTLITPCVFPMIPMTVNFFMHGSDNRKKNIRQAWIFGFSIIFIYAVLGVVLALIFGPEVMYFIGTHWIPNLIFFIIFIIFSLSFFGLFEIKLPSRWANKSDENADKGGILAPFFIALTTVLVSFSCTGPILGAALIELSSGATSRMVPLVSMLGFAVGFAAPFTLLALFPSALTKFKSGSWLNTVKVVFAFLELAFGLKFLSMADLYCNWHLLDREVYLALWIVIFALMGLYLLGKIRFKGDDEMQHLSVTRLFLSIITFAFVIYMIPGMWGAPLKAISGFIPPMETQDFNIEEIVHNELKGNTLQISDNSATPTRKYSDKLHMPTGFDGFYDLDEAKAYAKEVGKPIFIDFTGKTCANCREMEHYVWADEEIKPLLANSFVMCALYADENTIELPEKEWVVDEKGNTLKTLGKRNLHYQKTQFNMNAQPYYVIINSEGKVLTKQNYKYDRDVQKFKAFLNEGLENYK